MMQVHRIVLPLAIILSAIGVAEGTQIIASDPPNCAVDARQPHDPSNPGITLGWASFVLTFDTDPSSLGPSDFSIVTVGGGPPPVIISVIGAGGNALVITLDRQIEPQTWLCISLVSESGNVCFGYLPGDVNNDLVSSSADPSALSDCIDNPGSCETWQADIDRNGAVDAADQSRLQDLLDGVGAFEVWLGRSLPLCPSDAPQPIPTVSEWGLVVMSLLVLAAGTIAYSRRGLDRRPGGM